ncbi:helix-turn-helix transcriptional regulator [Streptomyces sp. NBC_00053]|uniref:helix-turn-helix domain-containing protein n=1 Tax=unclassified Streptomyces TaxID=2593676 RepID=UPI000F5BF2A4|nr:MULTISPECIES: helix-turn-helix transcriptional regulator [unclassified Streptomyces]WSG51430.1 helix-turn-helix transcriptional regulator [Streptomyces sp. NBC_01732]WSX02087.1 helix-turn-helix transcriptional regulator [Streptomyces sp. NBC_00987]MCX4396010.1 helix-turn-helix transcriptional regulator [Streptomyces sp. NBC_01767]MCX5160880.1 helix-turn-helix transcriptional regulator [Streptomyces sp. NBC_00305]MCX5219403.1 helix-turn-helix transcriptional regulator [Streptomyces sp. NBC_0
MTNTEREERPEHPAESDGTAHLFKALGKQIKVLREHAGMSQKDLGLAAHCGEDLISAVERGVRTPQPDFLARVDPLLNACGVLSAAVGEVQVALARARTRHPDWFRNYARVEAEALALHEYSAQVVPGLLQTEAYARAVFTQRRPLLDEATIEKRVADRLDRQQIFERWPAPTFSYVLEETVLRRPIGGGAVHAEQLRRLMHIGRLRTVEIQVMPTLREEHAAIGGTFTLITPKGRQQAVYTELYGNPRLITDPEEVRVFSERYGIIRAQALTPRESLMLIEKMLGEL